MAVNLPAVKQGAAKPKRPANLPHGCWLGDFEPLSKIERQLVKNCARGEPLLLGRDRPEKPLAANKIRAEIIRFLLLGGDVQNPVHNQGVTVRGAWVENTLELRHARCRVRLRADACRFNGDIIATEAKIPSLNLEGSSIAGLEADAIMVDGSVFLRNKFTATGEVRLVSADVGILDCSGGAFSNQDGVALSADRIKTKSGVFLRDKFKAEGEVRLLGACIGGNLDCSGATFSNKSGYALSADGINVTGNVFLDDEFTAVGAVRLPGAEIGGGLYCRGGSFSNRPGTALHLGGAEIREAFLMKSASVVGAIDLTAASVGSLIDDNVQYENLNLILDGFRYERIVGPTDARARIAWLNRQHNDHIGNEFKPQPWEQLIKVLREMGHPAEAAEIAIEKQRMLRRARKIGRRNANPTLSFPLSWLNKSWVWLANVVARGLHAFYGAIAGYGHRPSRIVIWMFVFSALCSLAYYQGRQQGLIGPSAPVLQLHSTLARCGPSGPSAIPWTSPDCPMPPEYSTFQPFFYSLDVILPFVDLHQETEWQPLVRNHSGQTLWGGRMLRWIMWFEIVFGWIASVMFVAIVGRLVDKD